MPAATSRPAAVGRDALVVLGTLLVLGVLAGVLWWLLVDPAEFTKTPRGGAMGETELAKKFAADGWFAVIGLVGGLVSGVLLSAWRSRDPLLTSGLVALGAAVAAGVAALVGHLLGPGGTEAALHAARTGARVAEPLSVDSPIVYVPWVLGALAGCLVVLLGRGPESEEGRQPLQPPAAG